LLLTTELIYGLAQRKYLAVPEKSAGAKTIVMNPVEEERNLIGCCGIFCGLCTKYQSKAPSRCIGWGSSIHGAALIDAVS